MAAGMGDDDIGPEVMFLQVVEEEAVFAAFQDQGGPERRRPLVPGKDGGRVGGGRRIVLQVSGEAGAQGAGGVCLGEHDGFASGEQREELGLGER